MTTFVEPSHVKILFEDGVCEEVAVTFAGECLCRLEQTPLASTTDARLGDVIEFEPEDGIAKMRRIAERSPFEMLTLTLPHVSSEGFLTWVSNVERDGCRVERAHGGTILVHVLPDRVDAIKRSFDTIARQRE